jgi:hypothetical protein
MLLLQSLNKLNIKIENIYDFNLISNIMLLKHLFLFNNNNKKENEI